MKGKIMSKKMNQNGEKMPNAHLHELMVDELKDIYNAERQLVSTAEGEELKNAFKEHLQETEGQIDKLKQVFQLLDLPARGKKCKAMEGLLNEADEIMSEFEGSEALDAALVAAAQKVEHYEIATYGSLATYAKLMQHEDVAAIFAEILEQEKNADEKLTQVAMSKANKK